MTVIVEHETKAVGTDAGNGEIGKTAWNKPHKVKLSGPALVGRVAPGEGEAAEVTLVEGDNIRLHYNSSQNEITIASALRDPSRIFAGDGAPPGSAHAVNDWYFDRLTADLYEKTAEATWTLQLSLSGPQGEPGTPGADGAPGANGGRWYFGQGVPSSSAYEVGDFYLANSTGDVYQKTGVSTWTWVINLVGPSGSGTGNVLGPAASVNGRFAMFSGLTGKLIADSGFSAASFAAAAHAHTIANITGLQGALDGKSNTGHGHAIADVTGLQTALDGKSPGDHWHPYASDTTSGFVELATAEETVMGTDTGRVVTPAGLQAAFTSLSSAYAPLTHGHVIEDVAGLQETLGNIQTTLETTLASAGWGGAPQSASELNAGIVRLAQPYEVNEGADYSTAISPYALNAFLGMGAALMASSSSPVVSVDDGRSFYISAYTPSAEVEGFSLFNGYSREIQLFFSDEIILKHGQSLVLPTGSNIYTEQGDVAVFRIAGSVTTCISYQRASGTPLRGAMARSVPVAASGTSVTLSGLPANARRITVLLSGVSASGNDNLLLQLGDSGGIENTGYTSYCSGAPSSGSAIAGAASSSGFLLTPSNSGSNQWSGAITVHNVSGNNWVASGILNASTLGSVAIMSGTKTLSSVLSNIRLTLSGSNTFDEGTVNVIWEW